MRLSDICEKLVLKPRIEGVSHAGFEIMRLHREIFHAIKRKGAKKAQEIMRSHLHEIKNMLLQADSSAKRWRARALVAHASLMISRVQVIKAVQKIQAVE